MPEKLPVVYRFIQNEVLAVFPTVPARPGRLACYAHIGQHPLPIDELEVAE